MSLLRKKSLWKSVWYSRVTLFLLLVLMVALYGPVYARFVAERDAAARRVAEEKELQAAEIRKQELESKVSELKEDSGAERDIRRRFDVAREGETVVILLEDENRNETQIVSTTTSTNQTKSWWQTLFSWLPL